jgi:thiol-disulfide isomerase/thioredoxin
MILRDDCPYCAKVEPWMEELSEKYSNNAAVNKKDIPKILGVFQVTMYSTFLALENGTISEAFFGDTVEDKVKKFFIGRFKFENKSFINSRIITRDNS